MNTYEYLPDTDLKSATHITVKGQGYYHK